MNWDVAHVSLLRCVCPHCDPSLMGCFRNMQKHHNPDANVLIAAAPLSLSLSAQTVMLIRLTQMTACITRVLVAMAKLAVLGWLPW